MKPIIKKSLSTSMLQLISLKKLIEEVTYYYEPVLAEVIIKNGQFIVTKEAIYLTSDGIDQLSDLLSKDEIESIEQLILEPQYLSFSHELFDIQDEKQRERILTVPLSEKTEEVVGDSKSKN
jgi:hypothetical protein